MPDDGGRIAVNPELLATKAALISAAVSHMDQKLADVNRDFDELQARWEGVAGGEYEARQVAWNGAADELKLLLAKVGGATDSSGTKYGGAEKANQNRFAM